MATYVAITSTGDSHYQICNGSSKDEVRESAELQICGNNWGVQKNIYQQTELTNLRVVSKTEAKRKYKVDIDSVENYW